MGDLQGYPPPNYEFWDVETEFTLWDASSLV